MGASERKGEKGSRERERKREGGGGGGEKREEKWRRVNGPQAEK